MMEKSYNLKVVFNDWEEIEFTGVVDCSVLEGGDVVQIEVASGSNIILNFDSIRYMGRSDALQEPGARV